MSPAGAFSTPRPVPWRLLPAAAGGIVLAGALPVFALAGWPLSAWALAAVLWLAAQGLGAVLARLGLGADNLAASGVVGIGMILRAILVVVPLIAVTATNPDVGLPAVLLYGAVFTVELVVGLASYFGTPA